MMEGFLDQLPIQFYLLACGIPLAMVALIVAWVYTSRNQQQREIQKKKEALAVAGPGGNAAISNTPPPRQEDRFVQSTTNDSATFNDDDDFDPLAELREARETAGTESSQTTDASGEDGDVALRDLLAAMDDDADDGYRSIAQQPVRVKLSTDDDAQATELLSILRDEDDGRLMVLFDETAYRTLVDAPDAKKQFTRIMKELSKVVLKPDDRQPEPEPKPEPTPMVSAEPEPTSNPPAVVDGTPDDTDDTPQQKTLTEAADDEEEIPGLLPDYSLGDSDEIYERGRFGRVKVKEPQDEIPELNIPEAINQYLQYKISKTPEFQDRDIHIRPSHTGGVVIFVDDNRYEFVDEIDDESARKFIQQAINEWQDRN